MVCRNELLILQYDWNKRVQFMLFLILQYYWNNRVQFMLLIILQYCWIDKSTIHVILNITMLSDWWKIIPMLISDIQELIVIDGIVWYYNKQNFSYQRWQPWDITIFQCDCLFSIIKSQTMQILNYSLD